MKKGSKQIIKTAFLARNTERELDTIYKMVKIYCKSNHKTSKVLCSNCQDLFDYAKDRTVNCIFGDDKPECSLCEVHCYKKEKREEIRQIMRFSGPRMIYNHPILAIVHVSRKFTRKFEEKHLKKN
jgi:hypothetical protein